MLEWRPPILETARMILRPIEEGDAAAIFAYASSPEVAEHTTWTPHRDIGDTVEFIRGYVQHNYSQEVPEPWGICLQENPEMVIGTIGVSWESRVNRAAEFHYALSDVFWGNGLIPEAAEVCLKSVFETMKPKRIQARCHVEHASSVRALEKMGFQKEGVRRAGVYAKGRYWDVIIFSMLEEDWAARQAEKAA